MDEECERRKSCASQLCLTVPSLSGMKNPSVESLGELVQSHSEAEQQKL